MKAKSRLPHISEFDSKINRLLELNIDGVNINKNCAASISTQELKSVFLEIAEMFKTFKTDIYTNLKSLGIRSRKTGSLVGAFAVLGLSIKTMLTSYSEPKALYQSIEHAHKINKEYEFVLNKKEIVPKSILKLIQAQHIEIKNAIQRLEELKKII